MRDEINAVTEVLRALGDGSQASRIEALAQTPDSTNLCVGVAGEVNRGKTTLIDALLGAEVLPRGVQPTTGVVTRVVYGRVPSVHAVRRGGRRERRLLEERDSWIRIGEDGESVPEAEAVEVRVDAPILEHGIVFLDTPGLNDRDVSTGRALEGLEEAGVVLLVLKATQLLSGLERDFVAGWRGREIAKPVVPVLNFLGDVAPEEQADVLGRLERWAGAVGPRVLRRLYFVVDALAALRYALGSGPAPTDDLPALRRSLSEIPAEKRARLGRRARLGQLLAELRACQAVDHPLSHEDAANGYGRTCPPAVTTDHPSQGWERLVAEASLRWSQVALEFAADFDRAYNVLLARAGPGPWDTEVAVASLESVAGDLALRLRGRADSELAMLFGHGRSPAAEPSGPEGAVRELLRGAGSQETPWPRSAEASAHRANKLWARFHEDLVDDLHDHWRVHVAAARRRWRTPALRAADRTSPRGRLDPVLSRAIAAVKDRLDDHCH